MRPNVDVEVRGWEGWYFEEDYLCSPEGDRFSPLCVRVCFFLRQTEHYREVLRWRFQGARLARVAESDADASGRVSQSPVVADLPALAPTGFQLPDVGGRLAKA